MRSALKTKIFLAGFKLSLKCLWKMFENEHCLVGLEQPDNKG
jgi:hypothetical protein